MRPVVQMLSGEDRRLLRGHPWAFANELKLDDAARAVAPGSVIALADSRGKPLGTATFNLHSLIAARLYDRAAEVELDVEWFKQRVRAAIDRREKLYAHPFYRLVHAEGDGLPGVVVDRYGDRLVVQINTAGAERLTDPLLQALGEALSTAAIVLRNDSPTRALEGLAPCVRVAEGIVDAPFEIREGDCRFLVDVLAGQKTGWFFDLAPARATMARLAAGGRFLDVYCHTGGFAIQAARGGAREAIGIDRSEPALALARASAQINGLTEIVAFRRGDAFEELERLASTAERFDCVVADPPSFVKSRRELKAGLQGYRRLVRLAAGRVAPGGFLFVASCSHHVDALQFSEVVVVGLAGAGRTGRVLIEAGAGPDHPVHAMLPETAYLKYRILQLD